MKTSLNKLRIIDIFIRFFILGAVFLLPLIFDAFSFLDSVFNYPKTVLLYIFVAGLFVATLTKIIYLKKIEVNKKVFKHILWPSIYILVLMLSTVFAFDLGTAFWGSYSRQFGLLTHLFLYLWFILLLFNLSFKSNFIRIKEIYKVIALSVFFISIYAILQYFGVDFLNWREAAITTKRAFSSLGQPNYLGVFLVMTLAIVFYVFKIERNKYLRYLWFFSALFAAFALFFTGSRSSWLGLLAAIFIFILYLLIKKRSLIKAKTIILIILALIIIFATLFSNPYFKERVNNSLNFTHGSVAVRLLYWEAAYDKITESAIIGYGPEQQKHVLRDSYIKEWAVHENLNTYSDRAHNIILDQLLIGGILLLFAYFMIFRSWFLQAIKALKKNNYQVAILILALIAYLITLFFSFEIIVSSFYFWLFGALIIVGEKLNDKEEDSYSIFRLRFSKLIRSLLVFALVLIFLLFTYLQLQKIIANHYFLSSKIAGASNIHNEALLLYNYSKDAGYSHKHYDLYFADSISYSFIENNEKPYREMELKLIDIENTLNLHTYDYFFVKGRINSALRNYEKAEDNFYKASKLSPEFYKTYLALADNYFLKQEFDKALKYYDIVIEKIPDLSDTRINNEHRERLERYLSFIWEKKGDVYYKLGDYDKAIIAFNKAYNYNLQQVPLLKKVADSYYLKEDTASAILYNKKGKQRNPVDPTWSTALAWLYYQQGDINEAKRELEEALSIREDYKSALDLKKEFNFNF
ncbi:MAG: O-antigen ligase family protein [Parcubacteria group bacterium]